MNPQVTFESSKKMKVCLIGMPFIQIEAPCHALGLLKSYFNLLSVPCDVIYLNLDFAEKIGLENYDLCSDQCFGKAAFGEDVVPFEDPRLQHIPQDIYTTFIEECLDNYNWDDYDLIMFTTVFSVPTTASFALARRLKEVFDSRIVFGGSAMYWGAGEEYVKVPWLDYVFTGHVDADSLGNLVRAIQTGDESLFLAIPDFCRYVDGKVIKSSLKSMVNMDDVPVPDYSDYFSQVAKQPYANSQELRSKIQFELLYAEFGRGCFYGDIQTCTFCSEIDIQKSNYRSYENGLQYLSELTSLYPDKRDFFFTDSLMGRTLQREIFPEWNKIRPKEHRYFCEVKPWMSRAEIKSLAEFGVCSVQCGIETLHSELIKLLRKGQKLHTCISALKWFKTYGIYVFWNVLVQIPGEKQEYYLESAKLMPALRHLPKPAENILPVILTKGAPYWHERHLWNFENLRPNQIYRYIIPSWLDLEAVSFAWECDIEGRSNMEIWQHGHLAIQQEINIWNEQDCVLELSGDTVTDSRWGEAVYFTLNDEERDCLVFCDTPKNKDQLDRYNAETVDFLIDKQLIIKIEHKFISLPIISDKEMYYKRDRATVQSDLL
ncbi:MAG: RiPP maturation radical SAM C-methyltransferase [Gammaproteobacteria bacterium]